jgi:hypothetical protein
MKSKILKRQFENILSLETRTTKFLTFLSLNCYLIVLIQNQKPAQKSIV